MKVTKFSKSVNETLESSKLYNVEEALSMLMSFKREGRKKMQTWQKMNE